MTHPDLIKAARAIHEDRDTWRKSQDRTAWDAASLAQRTVALSAARAILAGLLTLSPDVVEAGCAEMFGCGARPDSGWPLYIQTSIAESFTAMINHILGEQE